MSRYCISFLKITNFENRWLRRYKMPLPFFKDDNINYTWMLQRFLLLFLFSVSSYFCLLMSLPCSYLEQIKALIWIIKCVCERIQDREAPHSLFFANLEIDSCIHFDLWAYKRVHQQSKWNIIFPLERNCNLIFLLFDLIS